MAFLAKPDSITVPFSVSTLMLVASTCLLSTKRDFTAVVMLASSTYAPTVSCLRVTAQPVVASKAMAVAAAMKVLRMIML